MRIGSEVIRPLMRSVEDMPIHVRQIADMFLKHSKRQDLTGNHIDALDRVDGGWRTDTDWTPNSLVDAGNGHRPDPSDYLTDDYVAQHLQRFEGGATRFYTEANLNRYGPGNGGTTFVFPTSEVDDIIAEANGDPGRLGELLGLGENFFRGGPIVRADFTPDELSSGTFRLPSGNEGGANERWIPSGYLPEGIPEIVFDVHPGATNTDWSVGGTWGSFAEFTP
ncbi:hypothetical protein [Microbacterium dauci]|uniref:Uncharacterized protein n=1 Tax=Microbacterium dauci TaxID=3048008 RepID=A0ABT6ZHD5_9MICO|nr:hypothetical protein [Microbacterium sp. LX3-4]MDJ1115533.1 hypothetical protein [Microbacterium sp. LX3-4]